MKQHHVMTIGAHALDAELMGGPVAIKYVREGHKATFVHITRGERGHRRKSPEDYAIQLNEEIPKVAGAMGAAAHWMGYPAGNLPSREQMQMDLCQLLRQEKPDIVITHWRGSLHPRHVLTHDVVMEAVKMAANAEVETGQETHAVEYVYYGENCEDLDGFIPQIYIEIEDVFAQWFAAMSNYELFRSNEANVPYQDYYRTMAAIRAVEIGSQKLSKAYMVARRAQTYLHF